ncbi:hypothetical protein ACHEUQ_03090 [Alloscardovia omnicolens]|jgi:hypothetical protein|uniref:hypothetical protein n=1 Tax=Alloscardovia omnicolens TaxID=419015 RepID=UPI000666D61C|nr:hypothetical protein [Alloscardovia omnicolens]
MAEPIIPPKGSEPIDPPATQVNPPIDDGLQAKYDELLKHSREWEKRAKQNFEAAQQLEEFKKQNEELLQRANKADELQKELDEINATQKMAELKSKVSEETSVPANLLPDGDEETMTEYVKKLLAWNSQRPRLPISDQSKTPSREPKDDGLHVMARQLINKN